MKKSEIPMRSIYEFDNTMAATSATEIDELSDRSQTLEQRISSLNDSYETLKKREVELTEWRWVLREAGGFFDRVCTSVVRTGTKLTEPHRHAAKPMIFVNQWKTTTHRYFKMLSTVGQTETLSGRFQS